MVERILFLPLFLILFLGIEWKASAAQERLTRLPVNLLGVDFPAKEEGWVVGQLGKIFHTTDGGASWEEQQSKTNLLLTAVDFVDHLHGWIVGEQGLILHTADGGRTWERQQSGIPYPLFNVEFVSQESGWVVGHWGTILYTADGGKHWVGRSLWRELQEQEFVDPAALHDVIDPETGEVIAKAGQLLTTELIAEIIHRGIEGVRVREDTVLNAVFFLDQKHGWIVGERGLVLCTADGGMSWERIILPRPPLRKGATEKEGEPAEDVTVFGEEMSEEELEAFGILPPLPSLYGVFFVSPKQGWVVGQEATIAMTQDGGYNWKLQSSNVHESLYDIGMVGNTGWIVGDKGTVLVSTDGGMQWERRELGLGYRLSWLRRLTVISGDHAFLVGANGLVLTSGISPKQEIWIQRPNSIAVENKE